MRLSKLSASCLFVLLVCSDVWAAPLDISDRIRLLDARTGQVANRCGPDGNLPCDLPLMEGDLAGGEIGGANFAQLIAPRLGAASVIGNGGNRIFGMIEPNTECGCVDLNTPGAVSDYVSVTVLKNADNMTATLTISMTSGFSQGGLAVIKFDDTQVEDQNGQVSRLTFATLDKLFTPGIFQIEATSCSECVPEPATLLLFATGAFGLLGYGWRRARS